jgi:hypothetical protein
MNSQLLTQENSVAIKHIILKVWCAWDGHKLVSGSAFNGYLGRRRDIVYCRICHKVIT